MRRGVVSQATGAASTRACTAGSSSAARLGYNSDGGAVLLAPDGTAYAGSFGGVTRFRDR